MRRSAALLVAALVLLVPAGVAGAKHHKHKPSGVKGVVLDSSCPGACAQPPPPDPLYSGSVTITVRRASEGTVVASQATSDGHFRMRVKRGAYDVSVTPPSPPSCDPTPTTACPLQSQGAAIIAPCLTGETQRLKIRRHRFTRVELHVRNTCIV